MLVGTVIWSLADWPLITNLKLAHYSVMATIGQIFAVLLAMAIVVFATYLGVSPDRDPKPEQASATRDWTCILIIGSTSILTIGAVSLTLVISPVVAGLGFFLVSSLTAQYLLSKAPGMRVAIKRYIYKLVKT